MRPILEKLPGEPGALAWRRVLAEHLPTRHHISKTCFERRNLMSHWITSFTLVEHSQRVRPIIVSVQRPAGV
jgi:hypothetical protein